MRIGGAAVGARCIDQARDRGVVGQTPTLFQTWLSEPLHESDVLLACNGQPAKCDETAIQQRLINLSKHRVAHRLREVHIENFLAHWIGQFTCLDILRYSSSCTCLQWTWSANALNAPALAPAGGSL